MSTNSPSVTVNVEIVDDKEIDSQKGVRSRKVRTEQLGNNSLEQRPVSSPSLFATQAEYAASSRVIWEGANILTQGNDLPWMTADDGEAYYKSPVAKGKGFISFWLTDDLFSSDPSVLERDLAIALIEQFDLRAACLHLIYAAHATQLDRPWEEVFTINDTQLEQYLGLHKNKKLTKQQKLDLMLKLAKQPCHLLVYVSYPELGRIPTINVSRTFLWEIAEPILHFQNNLTNEQGELIGFTLNIRCGMWAKYFLNEENRRQKKGYYEYCVLSKELILDIMATYHHYEGAARLMTWLLFKTKINRSSPLTVELLLKIAFGEKALQDAIAKSKPRAKLVDSWIKTLKALIEKGWSITPDPQTYPMSYWVDTGKSSLFNEIPDDPDTALEFWAKDALAPTGTRLTDRTRRERGSFALFLNGRLYVQPPKAISDRLDALEEARRRTETRLPTISTAKTSQGGMAITPPKLPKEIQSGEQLKQLRITKGWSQAYLADQIGRSLSWVKMVETGKRNIQPQDQSAILSVLATSG
ncbi:helix-turn-helix transcriptional regulator (plasmid) [Phormidium sp. CLA17]|uniref:helix-turn-helix domain-containing protein n=1 Tax=Leptolyngbya sp. Cla-17 TaxID=2803751 RepID=UPI001491BD85|nr:helix-turn-helix transcriptional regulator [Leptolyngbya sp. Cla-17]MBM0744867.1 helix-turn-helix transcriptional regulator [Leptolyngbya sp. Cla-17]